MGTLDRRSREKEARREAILAAAKMLFAERGLTATTIDDIAEQAELAKGTVYLYFNSKEEVYNAIRLEGLSRLARRFRAAIDPARAPDENLRAVGQAYLGFYREEPAYFWVLYFATRETEGPAGPPEALRMAGGECIGLVAGVIQDGVKSGLFAPNIDPMEAAVLLWAGSSGIIFACEREVGSIKLTQYKADRLLQAYTETMLRALKA